MKSLHTHLMTWFAIAAGIAAAGTVMSGCSMSSSEHKTIRVELPKSTASLNKSSLAFDYSSLAATATNYNNDPFEGLPPPQSSAEFTCFAVNVTGPGIAPDSRMQCANPNDFLGRFGGFIPATGGVIEVQVPAGSGRRVQLLALRSTIGCPDLNQQLDIEARGGKGFNGIEHPFLVGETIVDLYEDKSVAIDAYYDPANPRGALQGCGGDKGVSVPIASVVTGQLTGADLIAPTAADLSKLSFQIPVIALSDLAKIYSREDGNPGTPPVATPDNSYQYSCNTASCRAAIQVRWEVTNFDPALFKYMELEVKSAGQFNATDCSTGTAPAILRLFKASALNWDRRPFTTNCLDERSFSRRLADYVIDVNGRKFIVANLEASTLSNSPSIISSVILSSARLSVSAVPKNLWISGEMNGLDAYLSSGSSRTFKIYGGLGPYTTTLIQNNSGGSIAAVSSGAKVDYYAGSVTATAVDILRVTDQEGRITDLNLHVLSDGSVFPQFGGNSAPTARIGVYHPSLVPASTPGINPIAIQQNGSILLAGTDSTRTRGALAHLYSDGRPDYIFGSDGSGVAYSDAAQYFTAVASLNDGNIVAGGIDFSGSPVLVLFTGSGTVMKTVFASGFTGSVRQIAELGSELLVSYGSGIYRYAMDLTLVGSLGSYSNVGFSFAVDPNPATGDADVVVVENLTGTNSYLQITTYLANAVKYTGVQFNQPGCNLHVVGVHNSGGKIRVAANSSCGTYLVYSLNNSNGSTDLSFGSGTGQLSNSGSLLNVAFQPDGRIWAALGSSVVVHPWDGSVPNTILGFTGADVIVAGWDSVFLGWMYSDIQGFLYKVAAENPIRVGLYPTISGIYDQSVALPSGGLAQPFVPKQTFDASHLYLAVSGTGAVAPQIRADASGQPSQLTIGTLNSCVISAGNGCSTNLSSPVRLKAGVTYWIVVPYLTGVSWSAMNSTPFSMLAKMSTDLINWSPAGPAGFGFELSSQ